MEKKLGHKGYVLYGEWWQMLNDQLFGGQNSPWLTVVRNFRGQLTTYGMGNFKLPHLCHLEMMPKPGFYKSYKPVRAHCSILLLRLFSKAACTQRFIKGGIKSKPCFLLSTHTSMSHTGGYLKLSHHHFGFLGRQISSHPHLIILPSAGVFPTGFLVLPKDGCLEPSNHLSAKRGLYAFLTENTPRVSVPQYFIKVAHLVCGVRNDYVYFSTGIFIQMTKFI